MTPTVATWIEAAGCTIVEVPAAQPSFQPDIEALRAAIGPKTSAVIINTPNNPVGAVYTRESLEALAAMLREREEALGRPLYLISDEPYREITYGIEVPWVPSIYARTYQLSYPTGYAETVSVSWRRWPAMPRSWIRRSPPARW